jgi:pimeloyl-ACP methyl ester carboxylesterase
MDVSTFTANRRVLSTDAGEIAYTEFGDGPVAVFVHGVGTNGVLWRHVIGELAGTSRCVAIDLPGHGATPPSDDPSIDAMAGVVADLCDGLGLGQVDLVANDTGGAIAQIFAARHPQRLRSLTLTNCDTEGNFPPPEFAPVVEAARRGQLAEQMVALFATPRAWRAGGLAVGYENPAAIPDDAWRAYLAPIGETLDRARHFERVLAAFDPDDLSSVSAALRTLDTPTLLVWGTGDMAFGVKWAYQLQEMIPGVREVIEVEGAKLFFPEERPGDLVPHLRRFWDR